MKMQKLISAQLHFAVYFLLIIKHRSPAESERVKFCSVSVDGRLAGRTRPQEKGISITQGRKRYSEIIFPLHSSFTKLCDQSPA